MFFSRFVVDVADGGFLLVLLLTVHTGIVSLDSWSKKEPITSVICGSVYSSVTSCSYFCNKSILVHVIGNVAFNLHNF